MKISEKNVSSGGVIIALQVRLSRRPHCIYHPVRGISATKNQVEGTIMKKFGKRIYYKIPPCLRWFFWPVRLAVKLIDISRLDLWVLSGEEITSHQELSIVYAGTKINKNYFTKMAYDNSFSENYLGRVWIWKIFKVVKEKGHNCSLMVVAVDRPLCTLFRKRACFDIPFWVTNLTDISGDSSLITKNKSIKSTINKIRKNNLFFEITQDRSQFDNFYYNMYRPYVTQRHGDGAIITEYDYVNNEFRNGELLLIKKENEYEYVAGALLVYKKKQPRPVYLGVKDGNFDYVKEGAVGAIFYFAICRFKEKGYEQVDFGGSRAFLKDGVLRYKRRWGVSQIASRHGGIFFVEPLTNTPGLKAFFINNPFIFMDKSKISGAVFVDSAHSFSQKELEKTSKKYYFNGMSKLSIYQFGENSARTQKILSLQSSDRIILHSAERLFKT